MNRYSIIAPILGILFNLCRQDDLSLKSIPIVKSLAKSSTTSIEFLLSNEFDFSECIRIYFFLSN